MSKKILKRVAILLIAMIIGLWIKTDYDNGTIKENTIVQLVPGAIDFFEGVEQSKRAQNSFWNEMNKGF